MADVGRKEQMRRMKAQTVDLRINRYQANPTMALHGMVTVGSSQTWAKRTEWWVSGVELSEQLLPLQGVGTGAQSDGVGLI